MSLCLSRTNQENVVAPELAGLEEQALSNVWLGVMWYLSLDAERAGIRLRGRGADDRGIDCCCLVGKKVR